MCVSCRSLIYISIIYQYRIVSLRVYLSLPLLIMNAFMNNASVWREYYLNIILTLRTTVTPTAANKTHFLVGSQK